MYLSMELWIWEFIQCLFVQRSSYVRLPFDCIYSLQVDDRPLHSSYRIHTRFSVQWSISDALQASILHICHYIHTNTRACSLHWKYNWRSNPIYHHLRRIQSKWMKSSACMYVYANDDSTYTVPHTVPCTVNIHSTFVLITTTATSTMPSTMNSRRGSEWKRKKLYTIFVNIRARK